jgi:Flp pilus assembly protein TadG
MMMMTSRTLARDARGSAAVEAAFALPILITLMLGLLQVALVLHANGALRHAAGQGIRFAKINPGATTDEVLAATRSGLAELDPSKITGLSLERGTAANGGAYARLSISYELRPVIPFVPVPAIPLHQARTAYVSS